MTPKGKTQITNAELDRRALDVQILKLIEYIEGGLENVEAHKNELKKLLNKRAALGKEEPKE